MPSARNTKSTAGESEDTSSDGNGGERPFPTLAHWPSAVLCGTPSAKVGAFFAIFTPTFWRHRPCTTFYGIPPSKVGVFMAISSPTFRKRCPYTALCGTPPAKVWYFSRFSPLPPDCTRPLRHSLSVFKSSPFAHQAGLPYTTAPFSVRNGLASASRTERCRFSVPHVSASGSRTTEGPFSVPDGESPQGYRVLRLRRSNLNTNMPLESNFRARL